MPSARPRKMRPRKRFPRPRKAAASRRRLRLRRTRYLSPGFPSTKLVKMRYVDSMYINPGVATLGTQLFRCNSIYDPDYSGAGHQPLGHDQWQTFYNQYVVIGSKITVRYSLQTTTTLNAPATVGIFLSDDTTSSSTPSEMMEQGLSKWRTIPCVANQFGSAQISHNYSPKKFFQIANIKDNRTTLGAAFGSNPTQDAYFTVWAGCMDGSIDLPQILLSVTIEYLVLCSEPKTLAQS